MIEIKDLNKYFNKGKKNQIHVINNTTLSLGDNGLVALLGPSGCGKTTLLNTIGGLDKVKSGSIYINNVKLTGGSTGRIDRIRNLNVGYIFQDYKLVDNLSVYDNVALVLKMIGIKDKDEIKTRVEFVLDKIGMLRYRNRPAGMLSGGERQRVGIARAIVKDPDIILADEPTGNLDSKNTIEIMNIIKSISKDRLVLLVTHEQELAKFYASRIIELKDGAIINDYKNEHTDNLDYIVDNRFYLKDFASHDELNNESNNINIYKDSSENINLDIVIKNGNIYIRSNTAEKVEVIDDNSSIEFVDDHYKQMDLKDLEKYEFNFKEVINRNIRKHYSSIVNPFTMLKNGFKKISEFSIIKKILLIGFVLSGFFIMYAVSSICATLNIEDKDFVDTNKNYSIISLSKLNVADYLNYENYPDVNYLIPGNSKIAFNISYKDYYQTASIVEQLNGSLSGLSMISSEDIISGRMPENDYEIVVDKLTLQNLIDQDAGAKMAGIKDINQMLNRPVSLPNMDDFTIVGIVDLQSPSVYVKETMFVNMLYNASQNSQDGAKNVMTSSSSSDAAASSDSFMDYNLVSDEIELKQGRMPENDYEVIVNISNKDAMPLNKTIKTSINGTPLTVVGYYFSKNNLNSYLVNNSTIKYDLILRSSDISIYGTDKQAILDTFRKDNLNINDSYKLSKENYMKDIRENYIGSLVASGIILAISLIEIFLMMRSSFLSRVKEIGIYRAIGTKKSDIYKMFIGEIFAITTLTDLPAILFMAYILKVISGISMASKYVMINVPILVLTIIAVYVFNLIIGLLPVFNTIRKTPAAILARYDLE